MMTATYAQASPWKYSYTQHLTMRLFNAQGALLKRLLKRQPKKQDMMVSNFEIQRRERTQRKTKNRIGRIAFGCRIKNRIIKNN